MFAAKLLLSKSSSSYPTCAADITPIPPSLVTADASFDLETPIPIPP